MLPLAALVFLPALTAFLARHDSFWKSKKKAAEKERRVIEGFHNT
jgi:hypothetical protein